jgi:protein TonB
VEQALARRKPNWVLRGFLLVSALFHIILLLNVSGMITVHQYERIRVALRDNEPPPRTLPRPRPKPPEPVDASQVKPLEVSRPVLPLPQQPKQPTDVDMSRLRIDSSPFGTPIALPAGGLAAPALPVREAAAPPASTVGEQEQRSMYQEMVRMKIEKEKQYPLSARKRHQEGRTLVRFAISERGELREVHVIKSSRNQDLDDAALEAVRKAAPYPPPPPVLGKNGVSMEIVIAFELH